MIRCTVAFALSVAAIGAAAQTYVKPHIRSDGTIVQGHVRSAPNGSTLDNYSSKGNINPYTGARGTVDPLAGSPSGLYKPPVLPTPGINAYGLPPRSSQYKWRD